MSQIWAQNGLFRIFLKIESLVLARNALKRSVLMVVIFWRKIFLGKNLVWLIFRILGVAITAGGEIMHRFQCILNLVHQILLKLGSNDS